MAYCKATFKKSKLQGMTTYKPVIITPYWDRVFDIHYASIDCAAGYAQEECDAVNASHDRVVKAAVTEYVNSIRDKADPELMDRIQKTFEDLAVYTEEHERLLIDSTTGEVLFSIGGEHA